MKHLSLILTFMLAVFFASAQTTQSGYVKTKGRLDRQGNVIPGTRLAGAAIELSGGNSTVSDANGNFTLTVPDKKYYLKNVQKKGYVIVDPDMLSQQYAVSPNPLIISMETSERQRMDQVAMQTKLLDMLEQQREGRANELDALMADNKLSKEEYDNLLQQLYSDTTSKKLAEKMAALYARMDFDLVDGFQMQLSDLILKGELLKADSLLNAGRDSYDDRLAYYEEEVADRPMAKKEKACRDIVEYYIIPESQRENYDSLLSRTDITVKVIPDSVWERDHLFPFYKSEVRRYRALHKNDSAAIFYMRMAEIVPADMALEVQLEAGHFLCDTMKDYHNALVCLRRVLNILQQRYGSEHPETASCYQYIGEIYERLEYYCSAVGCYTTARTILIGLHGFEHPSVEMLKAKIDRLSPLCE